MNFVDMVAGKQPQLGLNVTHRNHITLGGAAQAPARMSSATAALAGSGPGSFDSLLGSLDQVSGKQQSASALAQKAIIDPDSVDAHDISIAQAEAGMSLSIARNVLSRVVQGWKDIINTR